MRTRSFRTAAGVGDRLRAVALAEQHAGDAFLLAQERYSEAPSALRDAWRRLADDESRHEALLLARLDAIGAPPPVRPLCLTLRDFLAAATDERDFARRMASAELRGLEGGLRLAVLLHPWDPESAALFARIAAEEKDHIALAMRFFPELEVRADLPRWPIP